VADGQHPRRLLPGEGDRDRTFKVDESYPDEAILEVALLPKDATKVKPQIFFIGLKKAGRAPLAGELLGPAGGPAIPTARDKRRGGRLRRRGSGGALSRVGICSRSSSRRRSSASSSGTRRRSSRRRCTGRRLYVPPIPVKMAAAERRAVIATPPGSSRQRSSASTPSEPTSSSARTCGGDTTRDEWRDGDIPVVPYPVDDARWKFDYSYTDEIGLQVAVFPEAGEEVRPMVFNMSLRAVGAGTKRHWLVDSWSPRGGGGGSARRPSAADGSPFGSTCSSRCPRRRASAPRGCSCPPA
jgi:hypothetical protein